MNAPVGAYDIPMDFAWPRVLWFLLAVPFLAAWWLFRRRRQALPYPGARELQRLPVGKARMLEALTMALRLAILGLMIVALARPRWPDQQTRIPTRSTAMLLALDVSGSMAEKDFLLDGQKVSRLEAARHALQRLLIGDGRRPDDQIGLLSFAARAEQVCPPTLTHSTVLRMLDEAKPVGLPPDSSTNIGDALAEAIALLQRARPQEKSIILLSDGEHTVPATVVPDALKPRQAARLAGALGIRVHTVFVGPISSAAKTGEEALQDIARLTGGRNFRADDSTALAAVCEEIDQLERTRVQSFQYYQYHEGYPWVGLVCLVLSLGAIILEGARWLRVP
jgi:Ca-activated chloride channel family protein